MRNKPWGLLVFVACCNAAVTVVLFGMVQTVLPLWFYCLGWSASLVAFWILAARDGPAGIVEPYTALDPWGEGRLHTFDGNGAPCSCARCKGKPW